VNVARVLAERRKPQGHEAHRLIQNGLDPAYADWRMEPRW
jgi:hypothetical protein